MRLVPLIAAIALCVGCGGGDRITQTREVSPFDRLDVADTVDVEVVPGDGREVRVYGGEDVLDRVETASSGGVLRLDIRDRGIVIGPDPLGDVRVQVSASALRGVTIKGAADVTLDGVDSDALDVRVQGAGEIDAAGRVDRLTATIQGAGDANLGRLAARTADVTVQGAGDADIDVSEQLDVLVQGAGDVTYSGEPRVSSTIEGAGDLNHHRR
jgi:Putative auto-transporter adhesin, head GIN domain